jgi:hypothetical protein
MKTHLFLGLVPLLLIACDARVNTAAPGPDKVIEKNTTIVTPAEKSETKTVIVNPPAASTSEKTTTITTETKK